MAAVNGNRSLLYYPLHFFSLETSASHGQIRRCRRLMKHVIENEGENIISICVKSYRNAHMLRNRLVTGWKNRSGCSVSHGWMQQIPPVWPKSCRQHKPILYWWDPGCVALFEVGQPTSVDVLEFDLSCMSHLGMKANWMWHQNLSWAD